MSAERVIWLLILGFLVILLGVLISTWRTHKGEFRVKTPQRTPSARYPAYDAAARREEVRRIFKGPELEEALEVEAEFQRLVEQSERNAFQLAIFMGIAIVVGIAYASYRIANAP